MKTKEELKLYFENGNKPTQEHFWQWQDSYWHKDEKITQESVEFIEKVIPFLINGNLQGSTIQLTIPKETKKILNSAYLYGGMSYQITSVIFNEGLEIIESYAFHTQNIKRIKTPSTLKIIESYAFASQGNNINGNDSLEEIVLNEGLTTIGNYAFGTFKIPTVENLHIPSTVENVGLNAFAIPSLKSVSAPRRLDLSNAGIPETATITYR